MEPAAKATNEEKVGNGHSNLPKAAEAKPQEDAGGPKKSFAVIVSLRCLSVLFVISLQIKV